MKHKMGIVLTVAIVLVAAVFGGIKRQSYTRIVDAEDFMDRMVVAELTEQLAITACNDMREELADASVILRVTPSGEMEYLYNNGRQKVTITKVYKGEEVDVSEEVYVFFPRWRIALTENYNSVQCGFVNAMKEGEEYLIFLDSAFVGLDGEIVYPFYGESFVAPMFCYGECENVIVPVEVEGNTYVPYSLVKENEFFVADEGALQVMQGFKKDLMLQYTKE